MLVYAINNLIDSKYLIARTINDEHVYHQVKKCRVVQ